MYRIRLQIEGHAREFFPGGKEQYAIERAEPASVRELILGLKVSPDLVMAVWIDGRMADKETVPPDGATVVLLSPPAGG